MREFRCSHEVDFMQSSIVKLRHSRGHSFVSIPKKFLDCIQARYLRVSFDRGRLIYEPLEESCK